jgi:outer membrane immunogenic protein
MKKFLLSVSVGALLALSGGQAMAADIPPPAPAPMYKAPAYVPPAWSWTGFYIGLNGGYGWNQTTGNSSCINPGGVLFGTGCDAPNSGAVSPSGGLFGAQAGYNLQSGPIVWGLETDIQWSDIKGSGALTDLCCEPAPVAAGTFTGTSSLDWFGTVRGRFGYLVTPNALLYATGGMIYGDEKVSNSVVYPATGLVYPASASSTQVGWTAGAGLEYAFTGSVSAKIEGLYYDLGHLNDSFTCPAAATTCTPGYTFGANYRFTGEMVRAGLNYRFNMGGPIYGN